MVVKDVAVNTLDPDELSLQLKREMIEYPSRMGWCVPTDVFAERGQALPKNIKEVFFPFHFFCFLGCGNSPAYRLCLPLFHCLLLYLSVNVNGCAAAPLNRLTTHCCVWMMYE